jgi:hypothetical protein
MFWVVPEKLNLIDNYQLVIGNPILNSGRFFIETTATVFKSKRINFNPALDIF